jgi:outer membrane receptor protein involved in Fe transport
MTNVLRNRLLATTIIVSAAAIAAPSYAQTNAQGNPTTAPTNPTTAPTNPVVSPAEIGASTGPVEGQTPASGTADNGETGAIIVTGSRIPQPNLTSAAPVSVVTAAEIKQQGTTRIEDLLNTLPQVTAEQSSGLSNGATGTATVNLRDLGSERTLVLVNGRRLLPGDPGSSAADLNAIPATLIKSVQVLTGGASSTYGADAVAGVVNFIMDTDYTGFKIDGQYSLFQHNNSSDILEPGSLARGGSAAGFNVPRGNTLDGGNIDTTATFGTSFADDKGHIVAYLGYRKQQPVLQSSRDYSACTAQAANQTSKSPLCGGSLTSQTGSFLDSVSNVYQVNNGRNLTPGYTRYNFAPTNYYQRPDERYTAGFFTHYEVSDAIKPYAEFMFMDDRTKAQIAPSGDFGNTNTINCDNPLLSAQELGIACAANNLVSGYVGNFPLTSRTGGSTTPITFTDSTTGATYNEGYLQPLRRNVEAGPRIDDLEHTEYRGVFGSKGDIAKGLSYDAYYQYGRTLYSETYINDVSISRLTKALDVVNVGGVNECRSVENKTDLNCVPYDIFTPGGVTQAAVNYLSTPGFQRAQNTEQVAHADFTLQGGEYGLKSPLANDGLGVNFGFEHRRETLEFRSDEEFSTGDLAGQGAATLPVSGGFSVNEAFVEAQLPLIHDNFIYDLSVGGGYRYSSYKIDGGGGYKTNTFKFEATFAPVKDITFRGTYNRAVRAPNIQDLFAPQHVALDGSDDPCSGDTPELTQAQCLNTGVTAAQYGNVTQNPAGQYNGLVGGNANLKPEKATTKTFGVVIQPQFAPRLAFTVDYYDIKIKDAISTIGEDTILTTCGQTGEASLCDLIHRNPVNGSLWLTPDSYVTDTELNIGSEHTRGIDFTGSYAHEIGKYGSLGFNLSGTYLDKFVIDNGVSTPYDCKGYYGAVCGEPLPKFKGKARLSYTAPDGIGLSLQWRYVGKVDVDSSSSNPSLSSPSTIVAFDDHIKAQSYFDISANATIGDHYNLRAGVNNVADKRPPIVSSNAPYNDCAGVLCNGNTYPGAYDVLGRYLYVAATLEF